MTDTTKPAQAAVSHISGEMLAAVGRTLSRRVSFPVSESDIRRWALAVYYPDAPPERFIEAETAAKPRHGGITAPEDFNPFAWLAALQSAAPSGGKENDPGSENRLMSYAERPGRLGLMLFTVTEDTWTNQDGELVKRSRTTLIRY